MRGPESPAASWLSITEASKRLNIHPATLRAWSDRGRIRTFRTPGGHRRFSGDDVDALAANAAPELALFMNALVGQARLATSAGKLANESWYARFDDAANWIPARLTALGIVLNSRQARKIWWRDGNKHASPNAGQCEAAMAGALGVRLGGASSYDGHPHHAPLLCAEGRPPTVGDARAALRIVATVSGLAFGVALLVLARRRRS